MSITKIISGGQTGVDQAALDIAIKFNIPHGGWCPKGRIAELGTTIPKKYLLRETKTSEYSERTKLNVKDSDGTLILVATLPIKNSSGTMLTVKEAKANHKPCLIIDLSKKTSIDENNIKYLMSLVQKNRRALAYTN
ncbi:MAG: putative molybdenum carrier protein [Gammaproteobacteria bacterium]